MWISYSYDVGSISHSTESFCLKVPDEILANEKITYPEIVSLLKAHHAYLSETPIISYYNHSINAYNRLISSDVLDIFEGVDLELLVKDCIESEIGYVIDKVDDLEERIWGLEQRVGNQEEAYTQETEKQAIDIAMLYAAPLVRYDGIKLRDCDN